MVLGTFLTGLDAIRKVVESAPRQNFFYHVAVGSNRVRMEIVAKMEGLGLPRLKPLAVTHPTTYAGMQSSIGEGSLMAPHSLVTAGTTIGRHCILNVKASVSHDCRIGDYCNINPGVQLAGNVSIGDGSFVGAGDGD